MFVWLVGFGWRVGGLRVGGVGGCLRQRGVVRRLILLVGAIIPASVSTPIYCVENGSGGFFVSDRILLQWEGGEVLGSTDQYLQGKGWVLRVLCQQCNG